MLIEHDIGAEKMPGFMSMPTPKEEKDALWKLIKVNSSLKVHNVIQSGYKW